MKFLRKIRLVGIENLHENNNDIDNMLYGIESYFESYFAIPSRYPTMYDQKTIGITSYLVRKINLVSEAASLLFHREVCHDDT